MRKRKITVFKSNQIFRLGLGCETCLELLNGRDICFEGLGKNCVIHISHKVVGGNSALIAFVTLKFGGMESKTPCRPLKVKKFPYGAGTLGGTMKSDKISGSLAWTNQEVAKMARNPSRKCLENESITKS